MGDVPVIKMSKQELTELEKSILKSKRVQIAKYVSIMVLFWVSGACWFYSITNYMNLYRGF